MNLAAGIGVKAAGAVLGKVAVGASKFARYNRLWYGSSGAWESLARQRGAVGGEKSVVFDIAPRVEDQLVHPRLGSLAGKLDAKSLNELAHNPNAQFLYDVGTGNINIIQNIDGKLLRITTPRDSFKIISVGPIRENSIINSIKNGCFIPIGNQLQESIELETFMNRIKP